MWGVAAFFISEVFFSTYSTSFFSNIFYRGRGERELMKTWRSGHHPLQLYRPKCEVHIGDEDLGHRLISDSQCADAVESTTAPLCPLAAPPAADRRYLVTSLRLHSTLEPDAPALAARVLDNLVDI
jgi:hypothetical protein